MENETPKENLSPIDQARKIRDELRAENDRRENLLKEEQKLQSERMLTSSAGQQIQPKEETSKEYAEKVMKGVIKAK